MLEMVVVFFAEKSLLQRSIDKHLWGFRPNIKKRNRPSTYRQLIGIRSMELIKLRRLHFALDCGAFVRKRFL